MAHNPYENRVAISDWAFLVRLTGILMAVGGIYSVVVLLFERGLSHSPSRVAGGVIGLGVLFIWQTTGKYGRRSPLWFGLGLIINAVVASALFLVTSALMSVN